MKRPGKVSDNRPARRLKHWGIAARVAQPSASLRARGVSEVRGHADPAGGEGRLDDSVDEGLQLRASRRPAPKCSTVGAAASASAGALFAHPQSPRLCWRIGNAMESDVVSNYLSHRDLQPLRVAIFTRSFDGVAEQFIILRNTTDCCLAGANTVGPLPNLLHLAHLAI